MNMKILLNILYACLGLLVAIVPTKRALHVFQQAKYDTKRYIDWISEYLKDKKIKGILILSIYFILMFLSLKTNIIKYLIIVLSSLLCFKLFKDESSKEYIKPLVYTDRVKRMIVMIVILDLLVLHLFMIFLENYYYGGLFASLIILNWVIILISNFMMMPIETLVKNHYLNDAKKILDSNTRLTKIGITGSFGKTSTKNIVQSIISEEYRSLMTPHSYNTPMGITRTIREYLKPTHQIFVCEMGADHKNDIRYLSDFVRPSIGLVTSIGPQHLSTFGSLENIINEKMSLIEKLPKDGVGIINFDNEYIRNYKVNNTCKIIKYGIDNKDVDYRAIDIEYSPKGSKFKVLTKDNTYQFETKLLGKLNILNILSGIALSRELNVEWDDIIKAVKTIPYIEHRLELKKINGFRFIDNAFNSNPVGAKMSLDVMKMMPNKRIIVTPGMIDLGSKQYELNKEFGSCMKDSIDIAILVGEKQTMPIKEGLLESGFIEDNIHVVKTVKEGFALVYSLASKEDTILLENDLPDAYNV